MGSKDYINVDDEPSRMFVWRRSQPNYRSPPQQRRRVYHHPNLTSFTPFGYTIVPFSSISPNYGITEQVVYRSPCPVCGETGTMRFKVHGDEQRELQEHQSFNFTNNENTTSSKVKSWPDQLNKKAFYELVTGNEAKFSEL